MEEGVKARYEGVKNQILMEKSCKSKSSTSNWWKDMNNILGLTSNIGFYFTGSIKYKLGEGASFPFGMLIGAVFFP